MTPRQMEHFQSRLLHLTQQECLVEATFDSATCEYETCSTTGPE